MAIMKKMLFIINPRSGKEQIRSRLLEILDSFVKAGYGPSVYITQGPKDAEYQAARAKTKELVVCSGGDGTLNEVVSGLMTITPEKRPELGYIPSGSTNDFASSLGLPKNMNNTEGERVEKTKAFGEMLERRTGLPVHYWDERLTTVAAEQILMESGVRRENRKAVIDKVAAGLILQGYLDCLKTKENE